MTAEEIELSLDEAVMRTLEIAREKSANPPILKLQPFRWWRLKGPTLADRLREIATKNRPV